MKKIEAPIIGNSEKKTYTLDSLAQVIRVYQSNSHQNTKKTKTRGQVAGSTRKIYRQKGTGGARHGSTKAPIYVGGGIVFGPTGIKGKNLRLNQKLRAKALASVLTDSLENQHLAIFDCPKITKPSTKKITTILNENKLDKNKLLFIYSDSDPDNLSLSIRNLVNVNLVSAASLNALQVLSAEKIILTPAATHALEERISPFLNSK
jgi:large subunit ribosomal protein L4